MLDEPQKNRENLLLDLISSIRNNTDISIIIKSSILSLVEFMDLSRCFILEYDDNQKLLPIIARSEHLNTTKEKSMVGVDLEKNYNFEYLSKIFKNLYVKKHQDVIFLGDSIELIKENYISCSKIEKFCSDFNFKSGIAFTFFEENKIKLAFVVSFKKKKNILSEDIEFIKIFFEQIYMAFKQDKLIETIKKQSEKEALLRNVIDTLRTLDIKQIKNNMVKEVGKLFDVDRCAIVQYDSVNNKFLEIDECSQYVSSEEVGSHVGINLEQEFFKPFKYLYLNQKKDLMISDIDNPPEGLNPRIVEILKGYGIQSTYTALITYGEQFLGFIYINYINKKRIFSEDDINLFKSIANQAAVAIYNSKLYESQKRVAESEKTLRDIMIASLKSYKTDDILNTIVTKTGEFLKVDRCFYVEYDFTNEVFLPAELNHEYNARPDIKKMSERPFTKEESDPFAEFTIKQKKSWVVNNIYDALMSKSGIVVLEQYGIKSFMILPVFYKDVPLGMLAVNSVYDFRDFTQEEYDFLSAIASQSSFIIYQARLYEKEKAITERESLLKTIIGSMRSSLDIKDVKHEIVHQIGNILKADRVFFADYDNQNHNYYVFEESEYRSSKEIKSFVGYNFTATPGFSEYIRDYHLGGNDIIFNDLETYLDDKKLRGSGVEKFYRDYGFISSAALNIYYKDEFLGDLVITFEHKRNITDEEVVFLKTLTDQASVAIKQAALYNSVIETAHKETILKNIISELKPTRNLGQAYNKLLEKITDIFNLNRTLFLESSAINPDELYVKYEYVIDRDDLAVNNLVFPQVCNNQFLRLVHNLKPLVINDVSQCDPVQTSEFFKKYKMKALLAVPLVKYNKEKKVLGFIVLCSEHTRLWTKDEINLIETISESVVGVIWEITKFIETEDLRNTFVLTLAHDFQVPLIGQKLALQYLLKTSNEKNKEIIEELLDDNKNITTLLNKSVEIYNYESGKKKLNLELCKISDILNSIINNQKEYIDSKNVNLSLGEIKESYLVKVDKIEIMKVFNTVVENAIDNTPANETITIKSYKQGKYIITCVNNKGEPILKEMQEKIFKRYEMALAIERKIGAGTGLFLAKKILEAHKGFIWFSTKAGEGTTFYISLPLHS